MGNLIGTFFIAWGALSLYYRPDRNPNLLSRAIHGLAYYNGGWRFGTENWLIAQGVLFALVGVFILVFG